MKDFKEEYYEQSIFWNQDYLQNPAERERIQETISAIPSDTHSVLDVGCGNGTFVNALVNTFPDKFDRITGLDASKEALKYVKSEKIHGTIIDLPFQNESFDMVTCLEVLEHLPREDFRKGILELQRVSRKHIIVTVPNDQNLESSSVMCPECYCWFNAGFHMRNFTKDSLRNLFNIFRPTKIKGIGPIDKIRSYNHLFLIFYRVWIKPLPPETAICPQCGYQSKEESDNLETDKNSAHFLGRILFSFKHIFKLMTPIKKKERWLLALYEKAIR